MLAKKKKKKKALAKVVDFPDFDIQYLGNPMSDSNIFFFSSRICRLRVITYRIVSNKRPGGVAIFQKGDVYKRQVFNAKKQCLSLFTMTRRREI